MSTGDVGKLSAAEAGAGDFVRTDADNIELETALQQLLLNLRGDAVETNMALGEDRLRGTVAVLLHGRHCCGIARLR